MRPTQYLVKVTYRLANDRQRRSVKYLVSAGTRDLAKVEAAGSLRSEHGSAAEALDFRVYVA